MKSNLHWVGGPEDESEKGDRRDKSLGLVVLSSNGLTSIVSNLEDDDQEGNASPGVPAPLLTITIAESSEETSQDHDDVGNNSNKDVGTVKTSQQAKVKEQKWCSDGPVDISCPVDFTIDVLVSVWKVMLVLVGLDSVVVADTITSSHGKVGEKGKGCDESGQDMEETFLLDVYQCLCQGRSG